MEVSASETGKSKIGSSNLLIQFADKEQLSDSNLSSTQVHHPENYHINHSSGSSFPNLNRLENIMKSHSNSLLKNSHLPGITIGKEKREISIYKKTEGPGPSTYQAKSMDISHCVKFNKATSDAWMEAAKYISKVGPGQYAYENVQTAFGEKKKGFNFTIGCKYDSIFDQQNKHAPGPGDYSNTVHADTKMKSKSISINKGFGTSNRFKIEERIYYPGPADYKFQAIEKKSISRKRTISHAEQDLLKANQIPGPSDYKAISQFDEGKNKRGVSIGLKCSLPNFSNVTKQAFNKYTIEREFENKKGLAYSIGGQKRQFFKISKTPGPQQYNIEPQQKYNHSPIMSTPNNQKNYLLETKVTPGPGAYEVGGTEMGIRYSFNKSKIHQISHHKLQVPGVGSYHMEVLDSSLLLSRGTVFGKDKKHKERSTISEVGVGKYELNIEESYKKGPTIPKAKAHI